MDELTREFLIESQEGLDRMERCLTDLEESPGDTALLAEIFRSVHTIKGTTGFLGFKRLEKLAHSGENLLGLLREGKMDATAPVITALLQLLDGLRSILKTIEAVGSEGDGDDKKLIVQLDKLQHASVAGKAAKTHAKAQKQEQEAPVAVELALAPEPAAAPAAVAAKPAVEAKAEETDAASPRVPATSTAESTLRVDVVLLN